METSRILNSIGKEIFIIYYFIFKNSITTDIVKILIKDGVSNEAGARIRVELIRTGFHMLLKKKQKEYC